MNALKSIIKWVRNKFGVDKFIIGPYAKEEGWIGGVDPIVFKDRPDPLSMSRENRQKEMLKQIKEDVTHGDS